MSRYPEISSVIRNIDGKNRLVKRYGYDPIIFEEEVFPIPEKLTTRIFTDDGTEDELQRTEEISPKLMELNNKVWDEKTESWVLLASEIEQE